MTKRDEQILESIGMTIEEVDKIANACENEDYEMWDESRISYGSPFEEKMTAISIRLPESRVNAMKQIIVNSGISQSEFVRRAIDHELLINS